MSERQEVYRGVLQADVSVGLPRELSISEVPHVSPDGVKVVSARRSRAGRGLATDSITGRRWRSRTRRVGRERRRSEVEGPAQIQVNWRI